MRNRIIDVDVWVGDCHLLDGRYDVSDREEACDAIKHFADMGMLEINTIAERIQKDADDDANIIFGAAVDEEMTGKVAVTVIATDFGGIATGMRGTVIDTPPVAPVIPQMESKPAEIELDGGMIGYEVDFADLVNEEPSYEPAQFDIPDFLK